MLDKLKRVDWILFGSVILLVFLGLIEIFAMAKNNSAMNIFLYKQFISLSLGVFIMFLVAFFDYRFFRVNSYAAIIFYILAIVVLFLLFLLGSDTRGSSAWIKLGFFSIEPVEFTKIALIIVLSKYFSSRHIEIHRFLHIVVSGIYLAIPLLLVLLQPDLGSAIIVMSIWFFIVLVSGIPKKYIFYLFSTGVFVSIFSWLFLFKEYQKNRILTFLDPYTDPQGAGYNVIQSMIAVGDGGFFGRGLGFGSQVQFGFLPEAHTDFIFASIAEELGFFGVLLVFLFLSILLWRVVKIAINSNNNFAKFFCVGFISWVFVQVVINAGMNLGIMPVTGITFPFLSYGGSSLLSLFLALGIIQSIKIRS